MPAKVIPLGMMRDFKAELKAMAKLGTDKKVKDARQKLWMRLTARFGREFMHKNDAAIRAELDAAVREVQGG